MKGGHPPWLWDSTEPGFVGIITIEEWIFPGDLGICRLYDINENLHWVGNLIESPCVHGWWFRAPFRTTERHGSTAYPYGSFCMLEVSISEGERIPVKFWFEGVERISPR